MSRIAYGLALAALLVGCNGGSKEANAASPDGVPAAGKLSAIKSKDVKPGEGPKAEKGDAVIVLYRGTLMNGTEFDSNMSSTYEANLEKDPFSFTIGNGEVIKGWDEGLVGAQTGTVRELEIPSDKAYGPNGSGDKIGPNADLKFSVKVLKVVKKGAEPIIDAKNVKLGSGAEVKETSKVNLKYKGTFLNGKEFDVREKTGLVPMSRVIPGVRAAIVGMKKGGVRAISIPPGMAGSYMIRGNQFVNFEVEVLDVQ